MSTATIDNIDAYVRDINQYKLISRDEERRLACLARSSNPEEARSARDQLICANLRLVVKIAHEFTKYELCLSDLVAEGNLGLIRAVDKFDPDNGAKFSAYASWWIKQAIRNAVSERTRTIRIPRTSALRMIKLNKLRCAFAQENEREPSDMELAEISGLPLKVVKRLSMAPDDTVSMHEKVGDDSQTTFDSVIPYQVEDDADDIRDRRELLSRALDSLTDMDRMLIGGAFGLDGKQKQCSELAQAAGMSARSVERRIPCILGKLRDALDGIQPQPA